MPISASQVQKLREKTGAGFLDCKQALVQSNGDESTAIQLLREKGKASAAQKALRSTSCGVISSWISSDSRFGSLVEINCETDFVARTSEFLDFAKILARLAGEQKLSSTGSLTACKFQQGSETVESILKEKIGRLGENIVLSKVFSLGHSSLVVGNYIHSPMEQAPECGSLGVLVAVESAVLTPEISALLKELSMQVAAFSPKWVKREDVPVSVLEKETAIYKEQCRQSGKPEKAWEKIVQGKLNDFFKQFCLLEQSYLRDPKISVQSFLENGIGKGMPMPSIADFIRLKVGEE